MKNNILENFIRETVIQEVNRIIDERLYLKEGIDIDVERHIVSFNPNHQDNVDTNDLIHPYVFQGNVRGETVISLFERKDNEDGNDGNPLVYALKGIRNWKFNNPKYDIFALMKRFVSVTNAMQWDFDSLFITPSSNQLNKLLFGYLTRLVNFKYKYTEFFQKLTVEEVQEFYINEEKISELANNDERTIMAIRTAMSKSFQKMIKENNHIFSYKYLPNLAYRDIISQSLSVSFTNGTIEDYAKAINGKNVLILDDTVASGKTLSDSANAIREMFDPETITFVTLFSGKNNTSKIIL